ncbi:MAG: bifunctional hydroxymethylpyrimidine kinase/phosphomethylpyrimidine kinase, partial [Lachnospiraceae bacterium]|nr:bifunctional hydroxymethylpyrimidine kinase/phosphomethylpyrimidine kinase [Lachnospiraceae bacterium]
MKKVLLINDMSGYGNCSLALQIPVVTACGDVPCVALTSYLSSHTGYDDVHRIDLSDQLKDTFSSWDKNGFRYDACICGYISNATSILDVKEYLENQKLENEKMLIMVDPVMGDSGKAYRHITDEHIDYMKSLITIADVITPNLTEACLLTGVDYEDLRLQLGVLSYDGRVDKEKKKKKNRASENLKKVSDKVISDLRPILDKIIYKRMQVTIITGIEIYDCVVTVLDVYNGDEKKRQTTCNFMPKLDSRPGTGDLFDAMFLEMSFKGFNLIDCLKISTSFIQESLKFSTVNKIPSKEGPAIGPILVPNLEYIRLHTTKKAIKNSGDTNKDKK